MQKRVHIKLKLKMTFPTGGNHYLKFIDERLSITSWLKIGQFTEKIRKKVK